MKTRNLILSAAAVIVLCVPAAFAQQSGTGSTAPPADTPATIAQRKDNQQDRIAQGIDSGQLTAGETSRLENQQQGINREVSADKQANGGKLTGADRRAINQSQNRASRNIYRDKHNGARR